jgi:hypothetical protein
MAKKFVILNQQQQFLCQSGASATWVNEYPDATEYAKRGEVKRALRVAPEAHLVASGYGFDGEDFQLANEF